MWPIIGSVAGKGLSGALKETWRMGQVLTISWIVFRAYWAGGCQLPQVLGKDRGQVGWGLTPGAVPVDGTVRLVRVFEVLTGHFGW